MATQQLFSIPDVCKVAGLQPQTLRNWVTAELVEPAERGTTGTGNGHRFSRMQVLGIAYGWARRQDREHTACLKAVADYIRVIGAMDEDKMLESFGKERTHLSPFQPFPLMEPWPGADPQEFNLASVYYRVKKKIGPIAKRPVMKTARGRKMVETATR
jgi:hypothetical protein